MVEAKQVNWDVVEVESGDIGRGCDEGLYEKLDWSKIGKKSDLVPEAPQTCGVGFFVWSTALAYNADKLKTAPAGWADFWDVKKFPGKRAMRKGARYNLEFALMADGVAPKDVYKVLATKEGAGPRIQEARRAEAEHPVVGSGRAAAAVPRRRRRGDVHRVQRPDRCRAEEGKNLKVVWNGSIYDLDYWAIPKGSPNKALARSTSRSLAAEAAAGLRAAHRLWSGERGGDQVARREDAREPAELAGQAERTRCCRMSFWTDHGDELEQRFSSWASK